MHKTWYFSDRIFCLIVTFLLDRFLVFLNIFRIIEKNGEKIAKSFNRDPESNPAPSNIFRHTLSTCIVDISYSYIFLSGK